MRFGIFILIFFAAIPAFAADETQLPEKFLGWWAPYSATTAGVGLDIRPDGRIYSIWQKKKEYTDLTSYRFIYENGDIAYLIVHDPARVKPVKFWQLKLERKKKPDGKEMRMLNGAEFDCDLTLRDFALLTQEQMKRMVQAQECGWYAPPYGEGISLGTYDRAIPGKTTSH